MRETTLPGVAYARPGPGADRPPRAAMEGVEVRGLLRPMTAEFAVECAHAGTGAALLQVHAAFADVMRGVIVEGGCAKVEAWPVAPDGRYDVVVRGGDGRLWEFRGALRAEGGPLFEAHVDQDDQEPGAVCVRVANFGAEPGEVRVWDRLAAETLGVRLSPDDVHTWQRRCGRHGGRFDYTLTAPALPGFLWRFVGRAAAVQARLQACRLARPAVGE